MLHARHDEGEADLNSFTLELHDSMQSERIENVVSFVGEDASGSFGILANHARMMTTLVYGLARYRLHRNNPWQYLAMPGAVLWFSDNTLSICCRRYLRDENYERISRLITDELLAEEQSLRELHESLEQMEEAMLKQMWALGQKGIHL